MQIMHADVKRMTGIAEFIQRHRGGRAPLPRKRPGVVREGKLTKCLTIGAGALLTKMMMDPMMMMMNNKHEMTDAEKYPNMTKQEIEILKKNEGKKSDGNYDYIISEQNSSNYYQSSSADNAPLKISTNIGPELYNLQMKMPYSKKDHDILKMIHDILDDPKTPDEQKLQMEKQAAGIMTRPSTGSVSLCVYVPDNNKAQMAQMVAMMGKDIDGETDMSAMMMSGAGDMNQMMMMRAMNGGANGGVDYLKMLGITKVGLIKKAPTRSYNSQPNKDEQPPTIITDLKDPRVGCISVGRIFEMFGISKYVQKENSHVQHFEGRTGYKTLRDGRRLYDYWRLPPSLWRGMGTMFSGGQPGFEIAPNFILSMGMTAKIRAQVIWDATAAQTGFNLNMWRSVGAGTAGAEHIAVQMRFVSRSDRAARESLTADGFVPAHMSDRNVRVGNDVIYMKSFSHEQPQGPLGEIIEIEGVIPLVKGLPSKDHMVMIKMTPGVGLRFSSCDGCRVRVGPVNSDDEKAFQRRKRAERKARIKK